MSVIPRLTGLLNRILGSSLHPSGSSGTTFWTPAVPGAPEALVSIPRGKFLTSVRAFLWPLSYVFPEGSPQDWVRVPWGALGLRLGCVFTPWCAAASPLPRPCGGDSSDR